MKRVLSAIVLSVIGAPLSAEPIEMTGLVCRETTNFGTRTWEFYGDVAIRYYEDGSMSRMPRIGVGAYEKYDREGKWTSVWQFFDLGEGAHMRLLSAPGLIEQDENGRGPLKVGIHPFYAECNSLWEDQ